MNPRIVPRIPGVEISELIQRLSLSAIQARIVANRMENLAWNVDELVGASLKQIASPQLLIDSDIAVRRIARAIKEGETIGLLTDYDVDGITSHAILYFALRDYFNFPRQNIEHLIGHRIDDGYGISQGLTDRILAMDKQPQLIITADCGSSDEAQIVQLKEQGIDVIVTDHHAIPQEGIPASALATINPTRDDCAYPDATIAGCMVSWLLMSHLRARLIEERVLDASVPKLSGLLDFVSLGTVADAVSLSSPINRAVVKTGLQIMNKLQRPCWQAMQTLLDREFQPFTAEDLGFQIGPRINARSRMSDPYMALHYLCASSVSESLAKLAELDKDNQDRKATEKQMLDIAFDLARPQLKKMAWSLVVYHPDFHAGVQGIVASRLMEKYGRPVIVFSPTNNADVLTGSARTIPAIHIRDVIESVKNQQNNIILGFGGHKGAAGLKIHKDALEPFSVLFDKAIEEQIKASRVDEKDALRPVIYTDGKLTEQEISFETIAELKGLEPYGREFEAPVFEGSFQVQSIRSIGSEGNHLMLQLATDSSSFRAVWFRALDKKGDAFPFHDGDNIHAVYQLKENYFRGNFSVQLHIIYASRGN